MEIDMGLIGQIVSVLLLIVSVLAGGYLEKFKKKLEAARDLLSKLNDALTDDAISEEEWMGLFTQLSVLVHDCPGENPPGERRIQLKLIIAIAIGVIFLLWYFLVRGW